MIELESISIHFSGRPVLQNLSLQVPAGRIFGVLGGNGAGKSTMLNIILGFLKPDSGRVRVDGIDPGRNAADARGCQRGDAVCGRGSSESHFRAQARDGQPE